MQRSTCTRGRSKAELLDKRVKAVELQAVALESRQAHIKKRAFIFESFIMLSCLFVGFFDQ